MSPDTASYTIFIPTYCRPYFIKRLLSYYQQFNKPFHIVVADSSPPDVQQANQAIITAFPTLQVTHLTHYATTLNPHHKFADMVNHTNDPYCVFCADDDFVDPTGIETSIQFLDRHPDFSCAHGNYITFRERNGHFTWQPLYPYTSLTLDDPVQRFYTHLTSYWQVLYSVRRTPLVQQVYRELISCHTDPMQFGELLPDMLSLLYGKMQRLDVFYAARQFESRVAYWPTLFEYMDKGVYEPAYIKFKACLTQHLTQMGKTTDQAQALIDEAMSRYLQSTKRTESLISLRSRLRKFHVPQNMLELVQNVYGKIANQSNYAIWTPQDPRQEDLEAFNRIKHIVLESTKNQ